jgi:hypothetical protein
MTTPEIFDSPPSGSLSPATFFRNAVTREKSLELDRAREQEAARLAARLSCMPFYRDRAERDGPGYWLKLAGSFYPANWTPD